MRFSEKVGPEQGGYIKSQRWMPEIRDQDNDGLRSDPKRQLGRWAQRKVMLEV